MNIKTTNWLVIGALACTAQFAYAAAPDWSKVPKKDIELFHPATNSIEWATKKSDHSGSSALKKGETCAGCHEVSSNVDLGGGLRWPPSNGFTQIDERGQLSPALLDSFLPHRLDLLEGFINARCGTARATVAPIDPTRTLGGGLVGAAS